MITRFPDYFDDFHCLAGQCPDTCCGKWEIVVAYEAKKRYLSVEGELGEQIKNALTVIDGEDCMKLENGRCPLLTADGLCPIVTQLGEDFLSETCHTHPRFTEIYGKFQETVLSISCPEAARLLLTRQEPLTFHIVPDLNPPELNDLDAEQVQMLLDSRDIAYKLVQDRSLPLGDRLTLLLCFADRLQPRVRKPVNCQWVMENYQEEDYLERQLIRTRRWRRHGDLTPLKQLYGSMEHLEEEFPRLIGQLSLPDLEPLAVPLEQLTMYFLFRWWLKASCTDKLWQEAAACVVSVLTVAALAEQTGDILEAARLYSKEVEHSDDNRKALKKAMNRQDFSCRELLKLLEVPHAI